MTVPRVWRRNGTGSEKFWRNRKEWVVTGPKGRINRRLGVNVYESNGAIKALDRKEFPPGMHKRRKKPTVYGIGLAEKQKIKFYYGLRDRQLNRYFEMARRCLLYTSPSPRDQRGSRMPSSA